MRPILPCFAAACALALLLAACGSAASTAASTQSGAAASSAASASAAASQAAAEDYKAAYAAKVQELSAGDEDIRFALLDIDSDGTPELIADHTGFSVSAYTYAGGTLRAIFEEWPYGAAGNNGYEYLAGGNILRNYNYDQAGAIVYEYYYTIDADHAIYETYDDTMNIWYFDDKNGNGLMDEDEEYSEEPVAYYFGSTQVTAEKYASQQLPGIFAYITGTDTAEEILEKLE